MNIISPFWYIFKQLTSLHFKQHFVISVKLHTWLCKIIQNIRHCNNIRAYT